MKSKLKWFLVDNKYVNYLKEFDDKVENINYSNRLKPYIGILLKINELDYYVPISSVKNKHYKMKDGIDFMKITQGTRILGVLNLNNMIPINSKNVNLLNYSEIDKYRIFNSDHEKSLYISFLNLELKLINQNIDKIKYNATKLYNEKIKNPSSKISKRCCEFKLLEEKCIDYNR